MTKRKFYTNYQIRPVGHHKHEKYEFQLKYFLSDKEIFSDANMKYTETLVCSASEREQLEKMFCKKISRTEQRLAMEIRKIGANELNTRLILKQKMR